MVLRLPVHGGAVLAAVADEAAAFGRGLELSLRGDELVLDCDKVPRLPRLQSLFPLHHSTL